ncbi:RIP metalloprotease RseP [Candidatus Desantisbacteria bacterium]|nr:RIP metalloprotease RseP [Candidatus Desantisbacteria bacterium]
MALGNLLYFALVLGILVFIHELGHFLLAKKFNIKVEKFSLGMGPKIFGFKKGETEYMISAIPVGGYVKISGEDPEKKEKNTDLSPEEKSRKFYNKTVYQRMAVIFAGPVSNILMAIIIYIFIFMIGVPLMGTKVGEVNKDSVAEKAGILSGDKITGINSIKIELWEDMTEIIHNSPGKQMKLEILRDGKILAKTVVPKKEKISTMLDGEIEIGLIGITPGNEPEYIIKKYNPFSAIYMAVSQTYFLTKIMCKALVMMISRKMKPDVTSFIGIYKMTGQQAKSGLRNLWDFIAKLSINLGIINLFPFPVLDGGHIMFLLIEKIKGTPVKVKYREIAQTIGVIFLLFLAVIITYKDIIRFYPGLFK